MNAKVWKMGRTFRRMPSPIKVLCLSVFGIDLFVAYSAVPEAQISVFDELVSMSLWWTSGAGALTLAIAAWMSFAVYLTFQRSKVARFLYVIGWIFMSAITIFVGRSFGAPLRELLMGLAFNGIVFVGLIVYLWCSNGASRFFAGVLSADQRDQRPKGSDSDLSPQNSD